MGSLVEAQLRDALDAVHTLPSPGLMARRHAALLRLEAVIGPPTAEGLILIALAERAQAIAVRAARLERGETTALFVQRINHLAGEVLNHLAAWLQSQAGAKAHPVEPTLSSGPVVAMLVDCLNARPDLAGQCVDLFALAKAWERAGDLVSELSGSCHSAAPSSGRNPLAMEMGLRGAA